MGNINTGVGLMAISEITIFKWEKSCKKMFKEGIKSNKNKYNWSQRDFSVVY